MTLKCLYQEELSLIHNVSSPSNTVVLQILKEKSISQTFFGKCFSPDLYLCGILQRGFILNNFWRIWIVKMSK